MLDRLFVYGTLRPGAQAYEVVKAAVRRHEPAVLPGYGLVGEGHRYPWCVEAPGREVAGTLLWLRDHDRMLEHLDRYEGVDEDAPEYRRVALDVLTSYGVRVAWVYVGGPGVPGEARPVPGDDWLR